MKKLLIKLFGAKINKIHPHFQIFWMFFIKDYV
jgi:hypothetical protein